jgi:protein phosphatase
LPNSPFGIFIQVAGYDNGGIKKVQLPKLRVIGKTDRGLVRQGNEDYVHIDEANQVFAVCDGMGGHQAGEIASMTAGQTLHTTFSSFAKGILDDPRLALGRTIPYSADLLVKSIRLANRAVAMQAAGNSALSGMGTTIVAVSFEADVMAIAHVGDSRAYRLGQKELEPLTRDHSWVAEMQRTHNLSDAEANQLVGRNVITRALGVKDIVEVDLRIVKVKPGDMYILCSDGLCGFADDDEIFSVAQKSRGDIDRLADDLVQMANDRGGSDNVSVIIIEVIESAESPLPEAEPMTFPVETDIQQAAEDEWLARFLARENTPVEQSPQTSPHQPPSKKALFTIMALFAIVAVIIVYMATQK